MAVSNKKSDNDIIILQGIPGSGKTTYATKWVEESPEDRIRINRDDIRRMSGKYWVPSREEYITRVEDYVLTSAMSYGYDIIIDNMNLNHFTTDKIKEIVDKHNSSFNTNYHIGYIFLDTPLEECIARDVNRVNSIGEETIRSIYNKYKHFYNHN